MKKYRWRIALIIPIFILLIVGVIAAFLHPGSLNWPWGDRAFKFMFKKCGIA